MANHTVLKSNTPETKPNHMRANALVFYCGCSAWPCALLLFHQLQYTGAVRSSALFGMRTTSPPMDGPEARSVSAALNIVSTSPLLTTTGLYTCQTPSHR